MTDAARPVVHNARFLVQYGFHEATACNMCGRDVADARVLGMRLNKRQGRHPRRRHGIAVSILKCRGCGLNFPQPLPVPRSIEDHYGMPAESYWTEAYFRIDPAYFSRQVADAKRLLGFAPGMKALDIGAGIGKAMHAIAAAGFDTWGIEPSSSFRDQAIGRMGIDPERIVLTDVEQATFEPGSFDFVSFGAVLEHLYDPATSIERALSWLRPGGVIQIEVPSSDHLMPTFLNFYLRLAGTNFVTNLSPMHPPYHLYAFTLESFRRHGKAAGYDIPLHYHEVASIREVPRVFHPILRGWMRRTNRGMQLTVWLRKEHA